MFGNMGEMLKQAQALQKQMEEVKETIAKTECTGEAGAGLVKITINGRHEARRVEIDPSVLSEDKEMLEDLIAAAINDASHRVEQKSAEIMQKATGGLSLPPGMKLPF